MARAKKTTQKTKEFISTIGRRKRSVARIRLYHGKGKHIVNDRPIVDYFKDIPAACYLRPFELTDTVGKYYITAKIEGGGKSGQVGAFIHGLSRALVKENTEKYRKALKTAGFLMRDPREKERRKYSNAQKARARKQSPKR